MYVVTARLMGRTWDAPVESPSVTSCMRTLACSSQLALYYLQLLQQHACKMEMLVQIALETCRWEGGGGTPPDDPAPTL